MLLLLLLLSWFSCLLLFLFSALVAVNIVTFLLWELLLFLGCNILILFLLVALLVLLFRVLVCVFVLVAYV